MNTHYDLVIIGGGAAGMMAALQAKHTAPEFNTAILEKEPRPGRKLLATGNGRCNIANRYAAKEHYFNAAGRCPAFVQPALNAYPVPVILARFAELGLLTKEEDDGKYYPLGDQAAAVLDTLRLHCAACDIPIITECAADSITPGFTLDTSQGRLHAGAVILAMGGVASPQLGTSEGFAGMLRPLGHRATDIYPALTQIKTAEPLPKAVQGVKFKGSVTLAADDAPPMTDSGEVLFTATGISGPPVFQLSREVSRRCRAGAQPTLLLDMLPRISRTELLAELARRRTLPFTLADCLSGLLNKRLGQVLLRQTTPHKLDAPAAALTDGDLHRLADAIKAQRLTAQGVAGWRSAQVMAGGLELKGFDSHTLQSRRCPGLFAAGEVLDICGDCGGYNLTWAWSSACLAADSAVRFLRRTR